VQHDERASALQQVFHLCPTARFVGGTSRFLCECEEPGKCVGAQAADAEDTRVSEYQQSLVTENAPAATFGIRKRAWIRTPGHPDGIDPLYPDTCAEDVLLLREQIV